MFANEEQKEVRSDRLKATTPFPLGPNEPDEVVCGLLGVREEQGVGRAHPAPSAPWPEQLLLSHVMPTCGQKRSPHTTSSKETTSGSGKICSMMVQKQGWRIVPSGGAAEWCTTRRAFGSQRRRWAQRGLAGLRTHRQPMVDLRGSLPGPHLTGLKEALSLSGNAMISFTWVPQDFWTAR